MAIETRGVDEAIADLDAIVVAVRTATPAGVDKVMDQLVRQMKVQLSMGQHPRGTPTGSVAPSPPWRIDNNLRDSPTKTRARKMSADRWMGEAGPSGVVYERIQELGGWTGRGHRTHLPARPYVRPAWAIVELSAGRTMAGAWRRAVDSALH